MKKLKTKKVMVEKGDLCLRWENQRPAGTQQGRQEFRASRERLALTGEQCGLVGTGGVAQRVKGKPDDLCSSNTPQHGMHVRTPTPVHR